MKFMINKITQLAQELLDHVIGAELPTLYFSPRGEARRMRDILPQLKQKYRPTPWLSNAHLHLMYFDLIKQKNIHLKYDAIEHLDMSDGGITGIAWYGLDLPQNTPTIVLMHTLTGTPESMCELVRDLHQYTGWRIALCLHQCLPMQQPK